MLEYVSTSVCVRMGMLECVCYNVCVGHCLLERHVLDCVCCSVCVSVCVC